MSTGVIISGVLVQRVNLRRDLFLDMNMYSHNISHYRVARRLQNRLFTAPSRYPFQKGRSMLTDQVSSVIQIFLTVTALSFIPMALILMTSFTRIIIVLSFIRNALGTQQIPPTQVIIGLALFLTYFIMAPVLTQINDQAFQPYMDQTITEKEALTVAVAPLRTFMFKQTREKDLELFVGLANIERPKTYADIPTYVLIPSFVISELKTAFQIGFTLFIPFMVIDMIVSSVLMSMGMMMLPPMMISLPFKIMLFVLVDGWHLVIESVVKSFG